MNEKRKEAIEKLESMESFGKLITKGRDQCGFSRSALSDKIAERKIYVSEKEIAQWEKDLRYPDITVIYILAELLKINPTDLLLAKQTMQEAGLTSIDMVTMRVVGRIFHISIMGMFYLNRILFGLLLIGALVYYWGIKIPGLLQN